MTSSQNVDILQHNIKENENKHAREHFELQKQRFIHQRLRIIDVIAQGWNTAHESD